MGLSMGRGGGAYDALYSISLPSHCIINYKFLGYVTKYQFQTKKKMIKSGPFLVTRLDHILIR